MTRSQLFFFFTDLRKVTVLVEKWYNNVHMSIHIYILYISLDREMSRLSTAPRISSLYRYPNVLIRRGVEGTCSDTSISSVFEFLPPSPALSFSTQPYPNVRESSELIKLIPHTSVYLSLWFALVSRSQVSLINFVASLAGAGGIQAFKTMRTLRALRPLRAMSRMQGMRVCSPPSQQTLSLALRLPWRRRQSRSPMFNPFDTGECNSVSYSYNPRQ